MAIQISFAVVYGVVVGVIMGVWWARSMVARRGAAAVHLRTRELLERRSTQLSKKQQKQLFDLAASLPVNFRKEVLASGFVWVLKGFGAGLLIPTLQYLGIGRAAVSISTASVYMGAYVSALLFGMVVAYFHRRRLFVKGNVARAVGAGLPARHVRALRAELRESFAESGTVLPRGFANRVDKTIEVWGQFTLLREEYDRLRKKADLRERELGEARDEAKSRRADLLRVAKSLGVVTEMAQTAILMRLEHGLAEPDIKEFRKLVRTILKHLVESVGGPNSCRAVLYCFSGSTDNKLGFPLVHSQIDSEDLLFTRDPVSRDAPLLAALRTGHTQIGPDLVAQYQAVRGHRWRHSFIVPLPFLAGSGDTRAIPSYAALRVDGCVEGWDDLRTGDHRMIQMLNLATVVDILREAGGIGGEQLYRAAKRMYDPGEGANATRRAADDAS